MNLEGRPIWQVGAGDGKRRYDDICTQYDVMMVGPGECGPFDEKGYVHFRDSTRDPIRRFYKEVQLGDIVLLRRGSEFLAVGEVAEEGVQHREEFGDIDGWRLQHVRRVRWFKGIAMDGCPSVTFRGKFGRVKKLGVRNWAQGLEIPGEQFERELLPLPRGSKRLNDDMLRQRLSQAGLPSECIDKLASTLDSVRDLARMYWDNKQEKILGARPSEQETITYLVVPLLSALGWSRENMAIEWESIDVALFDGIPSEDNADSTLACVVEVKSLGGSVLNRKAREQAKRYATQEGRDNCRGLIITDGMRYSYFRRETAFARPHSYLSIRRMRESYPVYQYGGAVEAIMGMARI